MKPRKPDRFERVVLSQFERWRNAVGDTAQWHSNDVIKLLRNEHAWMRRMVKVMYGLPYDEHVNADYQRGYAECARLILEQLDQRRK